MRANLVRLWLGAAGLCGGVAAAGAFSSMVMAVITFVVGVVLLFVRRRRGVGLTGVVLMAAGAGMLTAQMRSTGDGPVMVLARDVPRCTFEATVTENLGGLGALWAVDAVTCGDSSVLDAGSVAVGEALADPGTRVTGEGWLIPLGDEGFDRARARLGAQATLHLRHSDVVSPPTGPHAVAARVRRGLHDAVSELDPRQAALLEGLTIGDTSGFSAETIAAFRGAGLSHVLAVSGSNVAIVVAAVLLMLRRLPLTARVVVGSIALCLFVLIVGPDASVLRAGVMGMATLLCLLRGRQTEPLAILALAVIGVVGVRPAMLYSVGMHLSVAATAGIILFSAHISSFLSRLAEPLRLMLAATLAAQIGVAPILMLVFGEISITAPVANLLALPVVGVATVVGLGAGCVAVLSVPLAVALVYLIAPAAWWIVRVADWFGSPEWAAPAVSHEAGLLVAAMVVVAGVRAVKRGPGELSVG